ncbi:MAG: alpha-glucan family phosphorylase, partial [Alistipes sp.]|nr:alpha-glucan family phosphorylase [Alistipes sp.]
QNELDAEMIYNTIEEQIAPKYYDRAADGIPHQWLASVKSCIADIASNFTTNRMLRDYEERFYDRLAARKREVTADGYRLAREIAHWKRRVLAAWERVRVIDVQRAQVGDKPIVVDRDYRFELTVDLGGLAPDEIGAELVVARPVEAGRAVEVVRTLPLTQVAQSGGRATYALDYAPEQAGMYDMALRIFPQHPSLPHRMDFALVKWA